MIFNQLLANSLIAGSIISLVAAGFSLIYSTNRFAHFAHGTVVAAGGYFAYSYSSILGLDFWLSIILSIVSTALLGWILYKIFYIPLKKKGGSSVIMLIGSIGLMILIENMLLAIYGANVRSFDVIKIQKGIDVLGATVTPLQILIIIVSIILFLILFIFVKKSKMGKIMRAVADNENLARLTGVNTQKIQAWTFVIGSALAGVAGILIGLEQNLVPTMGTNLIIKGFTGAVIGGMASIPGSVIGGYILGAAENFGIWYLPSSYKEAIAFAILLIFLLFRPQGLFQIKKGTRDQKM